MKEVACSFHKKKHRFMLLLYAAEEGDEIAFETPPVVFIPFYDFI